jgi:phenylalanine ammonia-lyase
MCNRPNCITRPSSAFCAHFLYINLYWQFVPSSSLALISARATINSLEVLSLLTSSYILALCQALDLRALQFDFSASINNLTRDLLIRHFGAHLSTAQLDALYPSVTRAIARALDQTSNVDALQRLSQVAAATTTPLVDFCTSEGHSALGALAGITVFRAELAEEGARRLNALRAEYLEGKKGPAPASQYLGKTKAMYEFVRLTLGIRMHGIENLHEWEAGAGMEQASIGEDISLIHEVSLRLFFCPNFFSPLLSTISSVVLIGGVTIFLGYPWRQNAANCRADVAQGMNGV